GFLSIDGVPGGNSIAFGSTPAGIGLDLDRLSSPTDLDATIENAAFIVARGGGAADSIDAAGGPGFSGPIDREVDFAGMAGADATAGGRLDDELSGGGGDDAIDAGKGEDEIDAGPGHDEVDAGPGRDHIDTRDGTRDSVRCGRGPDHVRADRHDRLHGCERV